MEGNDQNLDIAGQACSLDSRQDHDGPRFRLGISPGLAFRNVRRPEGERHNRYRREYRSPVYVVNL